MMPFKIYLPKTGLLRRASQPHTVYPTAIVESSAVDADGIDQSTSIRHVPANLLEDAYRS
jgi:hypothetical protein